MVVLIVLICCAIPCVVGIAEYIKNPKPPNGLSYKELQQYYYNREWEQIEEESSEDAITDEKRLYLEEAIVKYNKLLDSLNEQLKGTYNEHERSKIISKQITTLEKLTRALEKREKLE